MAQIWERIKNNPVLVWNIVVSILAALVLLGIVTVDEGQQIQDAILKVYVAVLPLFGIGAGLLGRSKVNGPTTSKRKDRKIKLLEDERRGHHGH